MPKILLQAGHVNTQNNSNSTLRGATGAPGEQEFTADVVLKVAVGLRTRGFTVVTDDANINDHPNIYNQDYDYALAVHYESDNHNTNGGFVGVADPDLDSVLPRSKQLQAILVQEYFNATKIPIHMNWQNPNTYRYYMWHYLTPKTPQNIIECGVGWRNPEDHHLFTYHRDIVVAGITRAICRMFGVNYDGIPVPQPAPHYATVDEFVRKWNGVGIDFDGSYGFQCMDLAEKYNHDIVGAPRIGGNAIDAWQRYSPAFYTKVPNDYYNTMQFPVKGDLMVWGNGVGQYGHIDLVYSAGGTSFMGFDQNWPMDVDANGNGLGVAHFQGHNYNSVLGWLHPKNLH